MDDALGLLIGLAGGLLLAVAFPRAAMASAARSVQRQVIVTLTGGIGGVLAARALVLLDPRTASDSLTTAAAALAGALWVAGAVGITLARRRHGDDEDADMLAHAIARAPLRGPTYDATRQAMVDGLTDDATKHDAGRYAEVGRQFASVWRLMPDDCAETTKLYTALRFWRGWMQARDASWPTYEDPGDIGVAEWPQLARTIASDLALDRELSSPRIRGRFAQAGLSPLPPSDDWRASTAASIRA
jgi:hypothetical protein